MIGNIGSGKTTLCKKLGVILDIPTYHFDQVVWQENWQKTALDVREALTKEWAARDVWVIDGVSKQFMVAADTVIFLDFPWYVCVWRTCKRNLKVLFRTRAEMPNGCSDYKVIPLIWRIIWNFKRTQNPWIIEAMATKPANNVFHVRSNKELHVCIGSIGAANT